jgi:hypothetical protein
MAVLLPRNSSNSYPQIAFSSISGGDYVDSSGNILGQIKQEAFYNSFTMGPSSTLRTYLVYDLTNYPGCNGIIVNASLESNFQGSTSAPNNVTLNFNHYFTRTIVSGSGTNQTLASNVLNIDNASVNLTTGGSQENTQTFPNNLAGLNPLVSNLGYYIYSDQIVQFRLFLRFNVTYYIKGITTFI